jgi:colicin import membrane protein
MTRSHPMRWFSEQARMGLSELPSNAAWLLSRALLAPVEAAGSESRSAASGTQDRARKLGASVLDAAPIGGDSVETRMKRARAAAERAREAEEQAVEAARVAKERADHARRVAERGRVRMTEVKRDTNRGVEQRIAEARRDADEAIKREREAAQADAEEELRQAQAEVAAETEDAHRDAEAAQERAKELVEEATRRLAEARRLADESTEAARAAADEAHRQAQQLVDEAEQQANDADAQAAAAEEVRERSKTTAKRTVRELEGDLTNGSLESYNKTELLDLAATIDIEGRTQMTKAELVDAIAKASRIKR